MIGGRFSGEFVGYAGLVENTSVEQLLDTLQRINYFHTL